MSGMSDYAQIPTQLICRFGELSKTEIRVVCFLYACRNRKTGICNPSRAAIGKAIGLHRAHITPVIKTLDSFGWICEMPDGNFRLLDGPDVVTRSVTNKEFECSEIGNTKVTESVTPDIENVTESEQVVTESVTECYENGNAHIRISSEQKNEQRNEQKEDVVDDHSLLMRHHAKRIGKITDGGSQGKAIKVILKNFSVQDAIGCYDFQVSEMTGKPGGWRSSVNWQTVLKFISEWVTAGRPVESVKNNGSTKSNYQKRTDADVLAESKDFYDRYPT